MLYGLIPLEKGGAVAAKPFKMLAEGDVRRQGMQVTFIRVWLIPNPVGHRDDPWVLCRDSVVSRKPGSIPKKPAVDSLPNVAEFFLPCADTSTSASSALARTWGERKRDF